MNLKNIKDYWHLLEAAKEGKVIQESGRTGYWRDLNEFVFYGIPSDYRVKPEPVVKEVWCNVYNSGWPGSQGYCSQKSADVVIGDNKNRTAYLYTRIEDGVMVEQKLIPVGN